MLLEALDAGFQQLAAEVVVEGIGLAANLGALEAFRCVLSYVWVRIRPPKDQKHFEGWTAARFGWRLYQHLFKTYTEKAWGIPADQLTADFAARIEQQPKTTPEALQVEAFAPDEIPWQELAFWSTTDALRDFLARS